MQSIFDEILAERERQTKKFGEQNIPCLDQTLLTREGGCTPQRMCENYEIPSENRAKQLCDGAFDNHHGTYAHIAVKELSEAISTLDPVKRREELVQTAAVLVGWIEKIDRLGEAETIDVSDKYGWIRQIQILAVTNSICERPDGKPMTLEDAKQLFTLETMFEYFVDNVTPAEALTLRIIEFNEKNGVE